MTDVLWFASPPEVHSALLSTGPGTGPMLAAAASWNALAAQYGEVAREIRQVLVAVRTGVWQGPTARRYVAAHHRYLGWLDDVAMASASTASQLELTVSAYSLAVSQMPTLAELALNHSTHTQLIATNFFGINTVPIALNEADYQRMWIQAATAMSVYEGVASATRAQATKLPVVPSIMTNGPLRGDALADDALGALAPSSGGSGLAEFFDDILRILIPAPVFDVVEALGNLSLGELLTLVVTNPAAAITVLTPLFAALGALAGYVSISLTLFALQIGSALFLFAPALAIPLAVALADPSRLSPLVDGRVIELPTSSVQPPPSALTAPAHPLAQSHSPLSMSSPTSTATVATDSANPPSAGAGPAWLPIYRVVASGVDSPRPPSAKEGGAAPQSHATAGAVRRTAFARIDADSARRSRRRRERAGEARMRVYEFLEDRDPSTESAATVEKGADATAPSDRGSGAVGRSRAVRQSSARGRIVVDSSVDEEAPPSRPLLPGSWPPH
ncbi:MAG: PPE domain-containing protein [Mycobacterium sp.]|nr:MAG: PPE domain-containing protein [Mycobacterium sp.]